MDGEQPAMLHFVDEVLRLIHESAPAERFQAARDELRGAASSPAALALADQVHERALQMRDVLSDHRRREIELGGLIATAADLLSLQDLEAVLAAICRRVRSLLGTDAAWITLVDPERGETYHCMTDGIVAQEPARRFRLSAGTGLGGLVMQTGSAEWTDDYLADRRFAHSAPLDAHASSEGFSAMLGAPMKSRDELLGIVITGNRGQRGFTTHDVTLLQTLADHAAIAIANARLLSDAAARSAELHDANRLLQANAALLERSAALHTRLSRLVLEGLELHELLQPVAELMDGRVAVVDPEQRVLAVAGAPLDELDRATVEGAPFVGSDAPADPLARALSLVQETTRAVAVEADGDRLPRVVAPMLAHSEPLGAVVLTKPAVAEGDLRLLESAALPLALSLANAHAQARAEHVVRGELLDDLVAETRGDADALLRRAHQLGWDPHHPYVLLVVDRDEREGRWTRLRLRRVVAESRGLISERADRTVLLVPGGSASAVAAQVTRALQGLETEPPTIGVARPAEGVEGVADAYRDARQALALALALGQRGRTVIADEADAFGIVFGSTEPRQLERFIERTLGPLLEHDRERGSELVTTLETWFAEDRHMGNTATAAFIHVNTLYKRMERIDELLGRDWRNADERLQLELALRLRRLATELDGGEAA